VPLHKTTVVVLFAALLFALCSASAEAATPSGDTIGPGNPTSWDGMFYAAGAVSDPTLCPSAALDPVNIVCDHFQLTATAACQVTVGINWPSADDDFDLYVYDSGGNEVASSADFGTTSETATFTSVPGAQYEVRVIPFFVVASGYDGTATCNGGTAGGGGGGGGGIDPPVWISDARVSEGDLGVRDATFTLTMGWATPAPATVNYRTVDGTARAANDYVAKVGEAVFAPGTTRTTITVPVIGDNMDEPNRTFSVDLFIGTPAVVKIYDGQGIGTIVDDDWGRMVRGSGKSATDGTFSLRVLENRVGKLAYRQGSSLTFSSRRITSIAFDDLTRSVRIQGTGSNAGRDVTFLVEVADSGLGTFDSFVLTLSDGSRAGGTLKSGNIEYRS
jgi:hypothetical protein